MLNKIFYKKSNIDDNSKGFFLNKNKKVKIEKNNKFSIRYKTFIKK